MTDDEPTDDEKAEQIVDYVASTIGTHDIARILLGDEPSDIVEPLPEGEPRDILTNALHDPEDGLTTVTLKNVVKAENYYGTLGAFAIHQHRHYLQTMEETTGTRFTHLRKEVTDEHAPEWLADLMVQAERDSVESTMGLDPIDYGYLIALAQLESKEFDVDNKQERKNLWDEALAFSNYGVIIDSTPPGGATETDYYELWRTSEANAHNDALRQLKRVYERDGVTPDEVDYDIQTDVRELFWPDTDPLPDIEPFVRRWQ